ncbi:hypothetical protein DICPUDRAFT_97847 [Dictyostelium purpureum]|uniref:Cytochrome P450 family protein n=1 Tax=Dictyostelium purpureum TaxID=5786 RepID=F0ZKD0_DICPU|nr:uncharacterized protein DICPUDRAFT_97847 [Dictyostelium purpureum]EGC35569.1 hypothetical protein DICPUDRAFT_97847 [Dictyostelium purpureum]|eukprot:XP_003287872.1 hypothetical protein DICPUDRAFT_97847 [Dictyostelium purpureum]
MNVILIIFYIVISYIIYSGYQKLKVSNEKQIDGPIPLPVIGNLHQVCNMSKQSFENMLNLYKKIVRIHVGDITYITAHDPVLIKEIYVDNFENFANRPDVPVKSFHGNLGIGTSSGQAWKENRRVLSQSLKKINIKHIYKCIEDETQLFIYAMNEHAIAKKPFNPLKHSINYLLKIFSKYMLNESLDLNDENVQKEFIIPMNKIFNLFGKGNPAEAIDILKPFYSFYLKYFEKNPKLFNDYFTKKVYEHLDTYDPNECRDLVDLLIKEFRDSDPDYIERIAANCKDIIIGGIETSVNANTNIFMMASNYPEVQEKVHSEIKSVVGKDRNVVNIEDRQYLPYTVAFIKESLRYRSPTAFSLPRVAKNDIIINDQYFIPKDAIISVNQHALSMNKEYYDNPEEFDPTRFLKDPHNPAFLPFTLGPRNCVGKNFSLDELFLFVSNIFLNFKIMSTDGKKIDESIKYGIVQSEYKDFDYLLEKR